MFQPLTSQRDIVYWWPIVEKGFKKVHQYGYGDDDIDTTLSRILSGDRQLILVIKDNMCIGFMTVKLIRSRYNKEDVNTLLVHHAYQFPNTKLFSLKKETNDFLNSYAKSMDCKLIKMYTTRRADKYWSSLGYTPTYTEYIKEI